MNRAVALSGWIAASILAALLALLLRAERTSVARFASRENGHQS